jgi:paraquat-inducible protein B
LSEAAVSIRVLADKVDTEVGPLGDSLTRSSKQAGEALKQVQVTLAKVQHSVEPESPLNYQITQTLQDISSAANAVHELADMLHRDPSALVRGRFISGERR